MTVFFFKAKLVLCLPTKRIFCYFALNDGRQSGTFTGCNVSDTKWAFPLLWRLLLLLLSHVIAVDLVLLSYICTKMDLMSLMIAFRTRKPLYACIKVDGQTFLTCFYGFSCVGGLGPKQSHQSIQKESIFYPALCIKQIAFCVLF